LAIIHERDRDMDLMKRIIENLSLEMSANILNAKRRKAFNEYIKVLDFSLENDAPLGFPRLCELLNVRRTFMSDGNDVSGNLHMQLLTPFVQEPKPVYSFTTLGMQLFPKILAASKTGKTIKLFSFKSPVVTLVLDESNHVIWNGENNLFILAYFWRSGQEFPRKMSQGEKLHAQAGDVLLILPDYSENMANIKFTPISETFTNPVSRREFFRQYDPKFSPIVFEADQNRPAHDVD
jgi:hypothetical protein